MGNSNKRANYHKISEEAGVSIATVSRVLNGSSKVTAETRKRVLEVMAQNGYDVAELSAIEQPKQGGLIIFHIPSMENPFYSQIAHGAKLAARRHGYQLLINEEHINDSTFPHLADLIRKVSAVGLIITNHIDTHLLQKLQAMLPLVQCCEFDDTLDLPYITIDDVEAARTAMEYLLSLGKRNIAFINGPLRYKYARHRLQGYLESLDAAGIEHNPELIVQLPEVSYDMAVSAVTHLLNTHQPTAFFCASDVFAAAVVKACNHAGLKVPDDVIVAGFDNIEVSYMTTPAITTVNQQRFQMGYSSCEQLVEMIERPGTKPQSLIFQTELIVRESTRCRYMQKEPDRTTV